jgi:hypothetical protein
VSLARYCSKKYSTNLPESTGGKKIIHFPVLPLKFKTLTLLAIVTFVLNLFDAWLTIYGLSNGAVELNPFNNGNIYIKIGYIPLLFAISTFIWWWFKIKRGHWSTKEIKHNFFCKKIVIVMWIVLMLLYLGVVINNSFVLIKIFGII